MVRKQQPKDQQPNRKQVGIHVEHEIWKKFRATCIQEGVSAGQQVEDLIRAWLKNKGA